MFICRYIAKYVEHWQSFVSPLSAKRQDGRRFIEREIHEIKTGFE
jgi:hypothetical protein